MKNLSLQRLSLYATPVIASLCFAMPEAYAATVSRNVTRTSVNRNVNVNVNRNVNVDVHAERYYHPVATAVAVGATVAVTAAVVGSIVHSVPPSCVPVQIGNVLYQQCGSTWYQPQYAGPNIQYIVVTAPR